MRITIRMGWIQEQLLHGRIRTGQMSNYSVHVIAGVVKSFLSSLKEPLVTYTSRESFTKIAYIDDDTDVQTTVCSLVPELPQPNRDTLAYLILHLQRYQRSFQDPFQQLYWTSSNSLVCLIFLSKSLSRCQRSSFFFFSFFFCCGSVRIWY